MLQSRKRLLVLAPLWMVLIYFGCFACSGNGSGHLKFPAIIAIDSPHLRVFAVDNQQNGLNLVNPTTDQVVLFGDPKDSLLNDTPDSNSPQLLPAFPSNAVVASLPGGVSRLFVVGSGPIPSNQVIVLDFDDVSLIHLAAFSPIPVAGSATDVLTGMAMDSVDGLVFVANSTTGMVHAFDVNSGAEIAGSPVNVGGLPGRMNFDPDSGLLAVSDASSNNVTLITAANLAAAPQIVDVGVQTRDVALATNANGTVLFLSGSQINTARVFRLDLTNLANSTQIFSLNPPAPTDPVPTPDVIPGNINFAKAANLTDGRMAGFFTESTGSLLELDLTSDLNNLTPSITSINNVSGEGLDYLQDGSGNAIKVYFASPGFGSISAVNPLTNVFIDQVE